MGRRAGPGAAALAAAFALALGGPDADAADAVVRVALVLPADAAWTETGRAVGWGVALAAAESEDLKRAGARRPGVETLPLAADDVEGATAAVEDAVKRKCAAAIAYATPATAPALEAAARKAHFPLILLGACPGGRTLDAADPVLRAEPEAGETALALAETLRLRSARSSLGLPPSTTHAWIVADDAPWARAVAAAVHEDDVDSVVLADDAYVAAGTAPAADALAAARKAGCDRVVVVGAGPTVRAVAAALDAAHWDVSLLAADAGLDTAAAPGAASSRRTVVYAAGFPACVEERRLSGLAADHPPAEGGPVANVLPLTARSMAAAATLIEAAVTPAAAKKGGVVTALRAATAAFASRPVPVFDDAGSLERWSWATWAAGSDRRLAPVKPTFLPDASLGAHLGPGLSRRFRAAPGATCVRIGFGDESTPRTVERDLGALGLSAATRSPDGAKVDALVLDQILARTAAKLSRIYLRSPDGSARPALSWKIAFVAEGADTTGASAVWDAVIAGDGPDSMHGGQSFPGKGRCQALSTYLLRGAAELQQARLNPPLSAADAVYLGGSYAWNDSAEGNQRSDRIRALLDGIASTYAMKLAKETGHLAGLSVDHSGEARSVMVAKGGEGVPDELAYFPPAYAKVLDKTLGRVPGK